MSNNTSIEMVAIAPDKLPWLADRRWILAVHSRRQLARKVAFVGNVRLDSIVIHVFVRKEIAVGKRIAQSNGQKMESVAEGLPRISREDIYP
jgi:hypothetical protein